ASSTCYRQKLATKIPEEPRNLTDACEVFEAVVREFLECPFPPIAYRIFADLLRISDLRLSEFRESWCPSAWKEKAVFQTYQGLDDYFIANNEGKHTDGNIVFKRTDFFNDRMYIKERMEKQRLKATDQANLAGASFVTYVYLMEDLRNGSIKIGKSSSPRKREKTLQSEEPSIHLRFAIPCKDKVEKELHNEFAMKRLRGEWFQLESAELLDLIRRLTKFGDSSRVFADYSWIGHLLVHGGKTLVNAKSQERIVGTSVDGQPYEEILARVLEKGDAKNSEDAIHDLDELLRAYPKTPARLNVMYAHARCSPAT
ncbi:MAG: GIY-YIG nuclease family protein, partial [Armatimonadota bacterium]